MKTITIPGQKTLQKLLPPAKGYVQNSFTGIGFGRGVRALDTKFLKGFLQRIGFTIPVVRVRADSIDFVNFALHNRGLNLKKEGFIAVGADKGVDIMLNSSNFKIPTSFEDTIAQANALEVFE
ncbi:MAG: hypothetical protein COA77_02550 [Thaumarchaeota archaeon]|nr:MAG: hypothetical protein COA77_02550 [Nitrososphaerota archaeon]